jgi:1,4-alpha-glucan branching enzyme
MVFRNADGSSKGAGTPGSINGGVVTSNGDIYMDLNFGEFVNIDTPSEETFFSEAGQPFTISATASDDVTTMSILLDEGNGFEEKASVTSGTTIDYEFTPANDITGELKVTATINGQEVETLQDFNLRLVGTTQAMALPVGLVKGINYHEDLTKVTLVLEAPGKDFVYVVGDFNDWQIDSEYLMNVTPDGELFWLELSGLTANQEYVFQYWVDGTITIGDPYADKVADPWNDEFIPSSVHNAIPDYNRQDLAIATTFQTGQTDFVWDASEDTWQRPAKEDLVVYELLVRDFIGSHDYKDLVDTLSYLSNLGVNAIELMPIMEFEGNESWGYNPMYFFAPDKYYGTKDDLKNFIQACHQNGMAVILDMVLNHAFGLNPNVRMYWDAANNKPSADNPWFNQDATHPFNVGFDFNHESTYTQDMVDSVNAYWISEYHFDGYRFDLSKGFTQTNNPNNVGAWGNYDPSRVTILERMANKIWEVDDEAYVILEHFADNSEETILADKGMVPWRNMVFAYYQSLGGDSNQDLFGASATTHISYMESHDEQRQIFEVMLNGDSRGSYNTRDLETALDRLKMNAAFIYLLPGPKMLWQFGELGYDIDIDENGRTGNKPLVWGSGSLNYYTDVERRKVYDAFSAIINLRTDNVANFSNATFSTNLSGDTRRIEVDGEEFDIIVVGNFGLLARDINADMTETGDWFDYMTGETVNITDTNYNVTLQAGEFRIYTSTKQSDGFGDIVNVYNQLVTGIEDELPGFSYYPNPASGTINFSGEIPGTPRSIKIYDINGNQVQSHQLSNGRLEPLDVSGMKEGLYLMRIYTDNNRYTLKLMVQD